MKKVMVANRGEIAIRIMRAVADLGLTTVGIYSEDDAASLHLKHADEQALLTGQGARPYLDAEQIVETARSLGCDALHPGYGFLSENSGFARACLDAGIRFIGPAPEHLSLFGDKGRARELAGQCGVPLIRGTNQDTSLEETRDFMAGLGEGAAVAIKAISGGGGRGMRLVDNPAQLEKHYERCRSEAKLAFGNDAVYVEEYIPRVRHVEVQVIADGKGDIGHLWERECTLQRQHQKLIEIAPSPSLTAKVREQLIDASITMAEKANFLSLGTFEFLMDAGNPERFYFIEANPRLQVEHTVTEEVLGIDMVRSQIQIARGRTLKELGLSRDLVPKPNGYAIQTRINMEVLSGKGRFKPTGGTIEVFEPPGGPGVRVDSFAYSGYRTSTRFDSLLAKLIVHSPNAVFSDAAKKTSRALEEFRFQGFDTNISFLQNLMRHEDVVNNNIHTQFVDDNLEDLAADNSHRSRHFTEETPPDRD